MILHPHQAGLLPTLDPHWRQRLWVAGLVLCLPVIGWPALLGYRAGLVRHLRHDHATLLPAWRGRFAEHLGHGLRAVAVIFGHLAPLYIALGVLAWRRGYGPEPGAVAVASVMLAFPIFATLSFPLACLHLTLRPEPILPTNACVVALGLWALLVFLVPAGFLAVSRTGRYRDAFAWRWTLPFVWRNLGTYTRAWWYSGLMSLAGHLALPLAPWGVAWCYLAIVALFNEVLWHDEGRPTSGWMARVVAAPRPAGQPIVDADGARVRTLDLGVFTAVLPGRPGP